MNEKIAIAGIIAIALICFFAGRTSVSIPIEPISQQKIVDTLRLFDKQKEIRFNKSLDSAVSFGNSMKQANSFIENSINKILNTNEKNKKRFVVSSDSTKHFISDSLLHANGYK